MLSFTTSLAILPQQLVFGLTLGTVYGLIAIGYTMVYGVLFMINFAHGDVFMIGAYIGWARAGRAARLADRADCIRSGCCRCCCCGHGAAPACSACCSSGLPTARSISAAQRGSAR